MGSENAHGCAQNAENGFGFDFDFLERYHKDGDEFVSHIVRVTVDETWVSFVSVETKEQSKQWMQTHSSNKPKKFEHTSSACQKADDNYFLVLMMEFMQKGTTVTSEVYCETLQKPLRAIQKERRGMLTPGVVLLHDNARSHIAARTRALLENFNWELFDHPPYSPDLATSDYRLFTCLSNWLRSQRFNDNELLEGVKTWLSSQVADFFHTGIQKLISRYDKCLNSGGDYFEKWFKYVRIFCV
jgi:transposase